MLNVHFHGVLREVEPDGMTLSSWLLLAPGVRFALSSPTGVSKLRRQPRTVICIASPVRWTRPRLPTWGPLGSAHLTPAGAADRRALIFACWETAYKARVMALLIFSIGTTRDFW